MGRSIPCFFFFHFFVAFKTVLWVFSGCLVGGLAEPECVHVGRGGEGSGSPRLGSALTPFGTFLWSLIAYQHKVSLLLSCLLFSRPPFTIQIFEYLQTTVVSGGLTEPGVTRYDNAMTPACFSST